MDTESINRNIFSLSIDEQGRKHFQAIIVLLYVIVVIASVLQIASVMGAVFNYRSTSESNSLPAFLKRDAAIYLGYSILLTIILICQFCHNISFAVRLNRARKHQDQVALNSSFESLKMGMIFTVVGLCLSFFHLIYTVFFRFLLNTQ